MYRIGIDLGGTNIAAGLVDESGKLLFKQSIPVDKSKDADGLIADMATLSLSLIEKNKLKESDIISIGIGVPGLSDSDKGYIVLTTNLPFKNTDVASVFKKFTSIPLFMNNDANCAALGEIIAGGAIGHKNALMITLGTGVGGGIIIDGKIFSGFNGAGGEVGHMVIHTDGEKCGCGRRGCLETYASATALVRETKKAAKAHPESLINKVCKGKLDLINAKTAFDAKRMGDAVGTEIVDKFIMDLSEGIINFVNIFQPEIILIGGGISREGEYLLAPVREQVAKYAYAYGLVPTAKIEQAVLGNDAGIIGAAMLS